MSDTDSALKYSWQKSVLDVFQEFDPNTLPAKIKIAEHAIAERLASGTPVDEAEHTAIVDVQTAFQLLFPRKTERRKATGQSDAA